MEFKGGYAGKILWINLSEKRIKKEPLPKDLAYNYLGGLGFVSRILFDLIKPKIDPLSPENLLAFATGPLTGTLFPQASRYIVAAKSPLTDIWGSAHSAGFWGPELKFAGYDMIIIRGRAEKPVYIWINDDYVEILDAFHLWGLNVPETEDIIRRDHGDNKIRVACIGPAGEKLVRFAAVMNDKCRAAARSGMGTVMGSKNLKAIAVRGSKDIKIADPNRYLKTIKEFQRRMLNNPFTPSRIKYGTNNLIELMQEIGRLPTYNMKQGVFEEYHKISGQYIRTHYLIKPRACFACVQRCGRHTAVPEGPYAYVGGGPEFEGLSALGSRCGVSHTEAVLYANHLCNLYGMDVISCGATISWAMECYERGIITEKDTGGLALKWGDPELLVKLVKMIAFREGFGDLLAEGSWRAARKIGRGAEKYVMHVKKQEIAGQEPRAQKSMGLASATAARGADHLYAFPVLDEVGFNEEIKRRFGEEYLPEMADRLNPKYKGIMVAECENFAAVVESVGVCKYGTMIPPEFYYEDIALALEITVGLKFTSTELRTIGERIVNLNRAFNAREGITRKDDTLPERFLKEPSPKGPAKGQVVELNQMLDEYYIHREWDLKNGLPTRKKLEDLNLSDVINKLEKMGILLQQ